MAITYQPITASSVHFLLGGDFEEEMGAEFTRPQEYNRADTGTRIFRGSALNLGGFLPGLTNLLPDYEYTGMGLESYSILDQSGNIRRVQLNFRGLIATAREARRMPSTVFGTFSFSQTNGQQATVEYHAPQTEYQYVVGGADEPTTPQFSGVYAPDQHPIKLWNLLPYNFNAAVLTVIERLAKFDAIRAGLAWEVTEVWVRELAMPVNDNFHVVNLPYVEIIQPEESQ